jgi:hypothetical protein
MGGEEKQGDINIHTLWMERKRRQEEEEEEEEDWYRKCEHCCALHHPPRLELLLLLLLFPILPPLSLPSHRQCQILTSLLVP